MKQTIFRTIAAMMIALSAIAIHAQATITWIEKVHDFGAFNEECGKVTCQFKFVNTGSEPVVIIGARASCGCTQPRYSTAPVVPGDTGVVSVTYDPAARPGRFSKKITIDTNTEPKRSRLEIKGVVIGSESTVSMRYPVEMGPLRMANNTALLGSAKKQHAKTVFIDGYNRSTDTIRPMVSGAPEWLDVTAAPKAVGPGDRVTFNFFVRPDNSELYGLVVDSVRITPTAGAESYVMPVVATFEESFEKLTEKDLAKSPQAALSTDRVDLGIIAPGSVTSGKFTITNRGKTDLYIRRIYTVDSGISISFKSKKIKPGKSAEVTLTATPAPDMSVVNARISIITNDPLNPTQTLRAVGQVH